ncbi:MAG: cystathionine gamma-lyase [Pseudomonadota bacterium]
MTSAIASERMFRALGHRLKRLEKGDPFSPPITPASKFVLPGAPDENLHQYGRFSQPTWTETEAFLSILEQAPVVAFPSGMAACAAVLQTQLTPGDQVIVPADGYYTVRLLIETFLNPMGVDWRAIPTAAYSQTDFKGAKLVWIETPSNPGLDALDLSDVTTAAKEAGALVVADNTTPTPLLQRPLDYGVDFVVCSDTKAASGHSDVLFGHVAARDDAYLQQIRDWRKITGSIPSAFDAWLVHRGLQTLDVRLERMCRNAGAIAARIQGHPALQDLRYPGLPTDPSHEICASQMDDFGCLVGFTFASAAQADAFIAASNAIAPSTSFGGVHSSAERRERWGDAVPEGYIRLSAGCEPTGHIVEDIVSALDSVS